MQGIEKERGEFFFLCVEVSCVCDQMYEEGTNFLPNDCQVTEFRAVLCE